MPDDTLVEAQAECTGMQTMAQVAVGLGDSADDAQMLAAYSYLVDYPLDKTLKDPYSLAHPHWSAACVPGGSLDVRPAGSTRWP